MEYGAEASSITDTTFWEQDPRRLLSRPALYELVSEVGFIRVFSVYNDFVYAPLTPSLVWLFRNLSILLENTPGLSGPWLAQSSFTLKNRRA